MKVMKKRILVLLLGTLLSSSLLIFANTCSTRVASQEFAQQFVSNPLASPMKFPGVLEGRYVDPDLLDAIGPTRVLVIASDCLPSYEVARYMTSSRATPSFKGFYMIVGVIEAEKVDQLAANPLVFALLKDRKIEYTVSTDLSTTDLSEENIPFLQLGKPRLRLRDDALTRKPETTLREAVNVTGAEMTWTDLGINGTDVTIAIVDTGVDYGTLSLGYWDTVARDEKGYPTAFDADAQCMVLTNTTVKAYMNETTLKWYLNTSGTDPDVYFVYNPSFGLPIVTKFSELTGSTWPYDMEITGIDSLSGNYHFGIMFQCLFGLGDMFPVLLVDSTEAGVYDTVYVDLSFDWWLWDFTSVLDASFADEIALTPTGRTVAARDFTGDGIYDISAGSLGYFLDVWGVSPNVADRGLVLEPVDPAGNYTVFVNDWWGHGTQCASGAGGRDKGHPLAGPGIAPEVKIMGIVALWIGDIIEAELWAAGFDLIPGTEGWSDPISGYGRVWGTWNYTGNHKADIISNSWGISDWAPFLLGLPWYDPLTILEDALMIPGYLDPDYPGTVVVHAGGNGAPGYGTITSPGYATLPISVGASTSFGTTASSIFGVGGGYFDDVISWSATGPTPIGSVKPDVVDVGAWAWVSGPVWSGLGNGSNAFDSFGGTSLATPLTSGSVALLIQGYAEAHGSEPTPETAKVILKSTAKDLGYDVFLQGSGRVDCFAAVSLALETSGVTIASPITWKNMRSRIQYAWSAAHESFGDPLQLRLPMGPINDTGWFAGAVPPGDSSSAEFTVTNPTNDTVTANIAPVVHKQIGATTVYSGDTNSLEGWLEGYGDQFALNVSDIPSGADLMVVTLMVPYTYFDPDGDYVWDSRFRVFILDWIDENDDDIVDPTEVFNVNYGYDTGTICEARVGFPLSKFKGEPVIWVSQVNQPWEPYAPVPYEVHVRYYKRNNWTWVTTPATISVGEASSGTFTANLTVPPETPQGVYEGQIMVNITSPYNRTIIIPVSLAVTMVLSPEDLALDMTPPATIELYDPYRVSGHFDWRWRYEAGDWKQWILDIQDPTTVAAFVSSNWTGTMTDIDMFGINPMGVLVDGAMSSYSESGYFEWQTRTGMTDEYVVLNTAAFTNPLMGVYTVLLHNVLFDGTVFPENVTGRVELVKLAPRVPINLATQSGQSALHNFTIITGKRLTNVVMSTAYPFTPFPVAEISPSSVPEIEAMNYTEFSVRVDVPEDTPEGTYQVVVHFTSSELPFMVYALINVTVDNTPPTISIVSPENVTVLRGNVTVEAYTFDPSEIEKVEFKAETTSVLMSFNNKTGHWTGRLDTGTLSDGENVVKVMAVDKAGNSFEKTVAVTVDNTAPSVSITSPEVEAQLSGTVTIEFEASDPNLELVQLIFDNTVFGVTGEASYEWDTTTVGDGTHIISLTAYDEVGNTATTHITVTTINVQRATEESYTTGKEEGYEEGYTKGYEEGEETGYEEGHKTGEVKGYEEGEETGYISGRNLGLTIGALIGSVIGGIGGAVVVLAIAKRLRKQP